MNFPPDPLTTALATEHLNASSARHDTVQRMQNPRANATNAAAIQGSAAGDSFNRSLDLNVLDKPSGKTPEANETGLPPLAATKAGINSGELVREGTGLSYYTTSQGDGKVNGNGLQPLALSRPTAAEIAEIKRVQMRQP